MIDSYENMLARENHLKTIRHILSTLRTEVELDNSINLYNLNIHAEYFYKELFNLLYNYGLENLNTQTKNVAYIDLIDEENKKAIQVTSQNDSEKIKKTIEGFFNNPENEGYELKVLLIAKQAKNYRSDFTFDGKYKFDAEKDVVDIEKIYSDINNESTDKIKELAEFLAKEVDISKAKSSIILPSNIPSPKGFIGRVAELDVLRKAKADGRNSFVLHGLGGVGKTDLALQFIKENKPEFEKHFRVDMFGLNENPKSVRDAMLEIIRAFGQDVSPDISEADATKIYDALLLNHKTILLFDNAKDRNHVEPLNTASALVVITSRETFNVTGGFSYDVQQMSSEDARNLLYSVTGDEGRFDGEADALAYLAGYLPMALLPLASLLADDITLKASDLVEEYKERKKRLNLADPNRENLSVEASFDLSYERLSDELKVCWRKLAVFPADFDLEAMQFVWQVEDGKQIRSELIKKHLLEYNKATERSYLHDLAFEYGSVKLSSNLIELRVTKSLFSAYYGVKLTTLDAVTIENINTFDREIHNFAKGFSIAKETLIIDSSKIVLELCTLYVGYATDILFLRLNLFDLFDLQSIGFTVYEKLKNEKGMSYCLNNLGRISRLSKNYEEAIEFYNQAISIVKNINELFFASMWLGNLANVYLDLGNFEKAIGYLEEALNISIETKNNVAQAKTYASLGDVYVASKQHEEAISNYKKALNIDAIDIHRKGIVLCNLAISYILLKSNYEDAKKFKKEGLEILDLIDSPLAESVRHNFRVAENN